MRIFLVYPTNSEDQALIYMSLASIRVDDFPARGRGYRATCPISRGSLLLQEAPLFRLAANALEDQINVKLADLSATDRDLFNQLCLSPQLIARPTLGRFRANALECVDPQTGNSTAGLFVHGARFNSSCTPNAHYTWDGKIMSFKTLKNIQQGEELCITYDINGVLYNHDQRKLILFNMDGFHCACLTCVTNDVGSDQRRTLIRGANARRDQPGYNMITVCAKHSFDTSRVSQADTTQDMGNPSGSRPGEALPLSGQIPVRRLQDVRIRWRRQQRHALAQSGIRGDCQRCQSRRPSS